MIVLTLPWPPKELSPNARLHWAVIARAKKKYRYDCGMLTRAAHRGTITGRHSLSMVFHPPSNLQFDRDNLTARMKAGIDGIADALGINDREFGPVSGDISWPKPKLGEVRVYIGEHKPIREAA